jgi:tRNA threonylcarbamoyladenosine biosynthesis protein TsaE
MHKYGKELGQQFRVGDLILISGALGAGKTALTQGIAAGLGISGVTSPTFVISRIHPGKVNLVHVDAYRLKDDPAALFDDLDLDSLLESSVVIIEWGENFIERLAQDFLEILLELGEREDERLISITHHGLRWESLKL